MLTPWEHSHIGYEYRVVAPCVVRVGCELNSDKTELVLKPKQCVRALERRIVSGVARLRIAPDLGGAVSSFIPKFPSLQLTFRSLSAAFFRCIFAHFSLVVFS